MTSVHVTLFVFFGLICFFANKAGVILKTLDIYGKDVETHINKQLVNAMILISSCLEVPLTFYQAKEFMLTLYDELKNASLSKKIRDLKRATSTQLFSPETVKEVRK